jgi:hypothetical protein
MSAFQGRNKNFMLHRVEIQDHAPAPAGRRYIEMPAVASEARVAVTVDVSAKRVLFEEVTDRDTSDSILSKSRVENAKGRTVRNENRVRARQFSESGEVGSDLSLRLLEGTAHEGQRILIPNKLNEPSFATRP